MHMPYFSSITLYFMHPRDCKSVCLYLRTLKAKVGSAWIYAFDTVRAVQVFGAFHLQAQASCKAPLGRGTCGTKENNRDAKGPKGLADPARTGPGGRRQLSFSDRGKTGCRLIRSIETIIRSIGCAVKWYWLRSNPHPVAGHSQIHNDPRRQRLN